MMNFGITSAIRRFSNGSGGKVASTPSAPPSVATGSGTPAVIAPPTVAPPPNAVALVNQQLATSAQLAGNTATGSGIGAGRTLTATTKRIIGKNAYVWLAALGAILFVAFLVDRRS